MSRDSPATAELMARPLAERNSSFSAEIPFLQIAWDSTSLGLLKECPRKYQYTIIEGWSPRQFSIHLRFGQIYHGALERYAQGRAKGQEHPDAVLFALKYALVQSWDGDKPWITDDQYKNRLTLVRSVLWYLFQHENDSIETLQLANGRAAVELSFRVPIGHHAPNGTEYLLCGHLDRIGLFQDQIYICDHKTTKSMLSPDFFSKYSPDNQMQIYDLGGNLAYKVEPKGIIIDGAQIAVTFTRFQRGLVTYSHFQREEFHLELGHWFATAANYAQRQFWPKNEKSCSNYGGCAFRPICSKSPGIRDEWLNSAFFHRIWNPLQVRGDI